MLPELRRVLVVGLARSGRAAALALARRGIEVVAHDRNEEVETGRLREAGVEVRLGAEDPALADGVDLLVKSPGVPAETPLVAAARDRGVPVWSEVELGARLLPNPLVGVTGTNGKTTTTELLAAIFRAGGRPVETAGNVGRPLTALDGEIADDAWIVCELSSFQLEDIETLRPRVALLLNLEPDHLDRHPGFDEYAAAKLRVFERQQAGDTAVVPRGFGAVPGHAARIEFSADDALPAEPLLRGRHNRENAAAATAAARAAGLADPAIATALSTFSGVPHRLELVGDVNGVAYVNDSKATNVAAVRPALEAYEDEPLHLILGGSLKGESFPSLAQAIGPNVLRAYLVGEATDELARALTEAGVAHERSGDLETAVRSATRAAARGDVVLLSPACASYDQFRDFEERGDRFRELVRSLG
ncbi:MAG: UDP-N-acetylmuramoyl-L-alanine--D-glutamate ligase [Actinobacteria bacterium]|nr:UDP-N-acetylmuramoyl-L-alanine--D-glutamate ligase [Actinomycetota bacterium]